MNFEDQDANVAPAIECELLSSQKEIFLPLGALPTLKATTDILLKLL